MTQLQRLEALATKYEEEARVIRRVIKLLKRQNHVESEKKENKPKKHWTQRPENREKVMQVVRRASRVSADMRRNPTEL